ncbi:MAG: Na+/H+ antiporter NhaC [Anaerovoracaceae bacterium]
MGKKIPMWQVLFVMAFLVVSLMYSMNILNKITGIDALASDYGTAHIPLILSATVAGIIAVANGWKWSYLEAGIMASINRSMQACLILLIIGILIGVWIAAGVVPAMIYYGLLILKPSIFLAAACLLCCIVSLATGSSWTTAGTIGIALIGIAQGLDMNIYITAGAIVSGAYFGDKMSPLSDTTNLAPAIAGSTLFEHIRHMVYTVTPSLVIALIIYVILGLKHSGNADINAVYAIQEGLKLNFNITPLLLIPPLVVIMIVAFKLPAIPGLLGGVFIGAILGVFTQGVGLNAWLNLSHHGYTYSATIEEYAPIVAQYGSEIAETTLKNLGQLLTRGGMESMLFTVSLIICAMCFGGILDSTGMLATLANSLLKFAKGTGSLITVTVFSCVVVNALAADQYLSIILPGRMYKEAYEDRRLKSKNLSRVLEDAGTITSCLIPWNTCGATMQTFLGVKTWGAPGVGYGWWAFLNLINPLVSIFYGFTGFTMEKMTEEEYQLLLKDRETAKAEAIKAAEA